MWPIRSASWRASRRPTTSPGPYDVVAKAEAETMDDLGKMVLSKVQMIGGITRTLTCPVVNL